MCIRPTFMNAQSCEPLKNIKENGFDASFFVFFHFIGAPVFIVTLLRPSLPVAPCLKNVNKALKLLAFCRLCRAMAWHAGRWSCPS